MMINKAIRLIEDHMRVHKIGEYPHVFLAEALNMAIAALCAQQEAEKNEPLTLDELREMGGEPYWHVGLRDESPPPHWSILDPFYTQHIEDYNYGKYWLAYRRRPEEGGDTNA